MHMLLQAHIEIEYLMGCSYHIHYYSETVLARRLMAHSPYSKTCVKRPLPKRPKIGFQDQLSLNAGQKYCRMLPLEHSAILLTFKGEHSAILLTFIKLPFVIKIFVLSTFEWPF